MTRKFIAGLLAALGIVATAGVAVASADHDGMTHNNPQAAQCRCMTHN